jgi:hypothetical protein
VDYDWLPAMIQADRGIAGVMIFDSGQKIHFLESHGIPSESGMDVSNHVPWVETHQRR